MLTEPFLRYSYLRYTGNSLNITPLGDIINRFAHTFLVMTVRPELHTEWTDGSIKVEGVVQMCPTYLSTMWFKIHQPFRHKGGRGLLTCLYNTLGACSKFIHTHMCLME